MGEYRILDWTPEEYGFKPIVPYGRDKKPMWKRIVGRKIFILIRLSDTLFVLKKEVTKSQDDGTKTVRLLVKFHTVIDSKKLADVYLTDGLRG